MDGLFPSSCSPFRHKLDDFICNFREIAIPVTRFFLLDPLYLSKQNWFGPT